MSKHITMKMWEEAGSFDRVAVPGDTVDEEIVEEMMNNVPSLYCNADCTSSGSLDKSNLNFIRNRGGSIYA